MLHIPTQNAAAVKKLLEQHAHPEKAEVMQRFFKTGKGEYGEGDQFIGVTVPLQRKVAKQFQKLAVVEIRRLLNSPVHEHRLTGLIILTYQYEATAKLQDRKAQAIVQKKFYTFYLSNTARINNWDLVDVTAPKIVGEYLRDKPKNILYSLAKSKNLWERRIAILATLAFIRHDQYDDVLALAEMLLKDEHDLIHKAVGWMLREIGKRDQSQLEQFLEQHAHQMPRTMLRYAIEKLSQKRRAYYMTKTA